ncbi:peptidase [Microtetraspora sp. AC03309]|uniref:S41 family peptidase n=1 Tax=Microtetraspora sp. AC03309 TaxID=2779376 RepID=UPI001E41F253|nr:S41 family peptidase [Microtetraspora sp. AC03309]MCC5575787.1 peptidase [Microtetraspora sp. AC03309]
MRWKSAAAGLALLLAAACSAPTVPRAEGTKATLGGASACARSSAPTGAMTPTTVDVIEQAYYCILDNYYSGATLDARKLLLAGFTAMTQELNRGGRDVPEAMMPPLTGDRKADWAAFEAAYRKVTDRVPQLADKLAAATLEAIVAALGDNHARWTHDDTRSPDYYDGDRYGLGLETNANAGHLAVAVAPLFVTDVVGGAAQEAGVRPGDVIESADGSATFVNGKPVPPAIAALNPVYPEARPVELSLLRRSTGRRWTVTLKPGLFTPTPDALRMVGSKLVDGKVAYVRLRGFATDGATRVLREITRLRTGRTLTGVVLDLRGNGGGSPVEATRLVSAFVHGKVTAYQCDVSGQCDTSRTDDTVELVGLPLIVLTDRDCASACEHFSSAIKDNGAGRLIGTRTAGVISGPADPWLLSNNTLLTFPSKHHLGPNREVIDGVGVAPDSYVPLTPADAAAGRDAALAKALTLLQE